MRLMTIVCVLWLVGLGSPILAQQADKEQPKEITNSIGIRLVLIPKGTFTMGSPPSEEGSQSNEFQYEVTISQDYYLGVTEVTQGQYLKVMGENPSRFQGDEIAERTPAKKHPTTGQTLEEERVVPVDSSNYPVERVTCNEAAEFCERLSALPEEQAAGRVYRLATEAEWEYACRRGARQRIVSVMP